MSTTTTSTYTSTTLVGMLPTITNATALVAGKSCPTCGQDGLLSQHHSEEAQRRIHELEGQLQHLNLQTAHMTEKLALYEEEIHRLRVQARSSAASSSSSAAAADPDRSLSPTQLPPPSSSHSQSHSQGQGRLSTLTSLLPSRRPSTTATTTSSPPQSTAHPVAQPSPPPQPAHEDTVELQNALSREQNLRRAAESQLSQTATELEELTAQLFSQANEMVAQERKARARLEERVAVLERRDVEKRNRLERLEKAMQRVERVRALVQ
ncbi:hypothetical protein ATEIFO6365_0002039800 [Aspergillus terreus]|uniref:GDP/GTP exchange factor Sec2 N-terminal domain-containing protein n=1 Tax=Aspergillus terreus TaxID=33178 RepID=A0A5M3YWE4_ASPTE|nr:hypothetical protein ATETN484_0004039800 [Aspergillus terreus]GFF13287.1 hypothetical protein ATEIFO6365_0002039800 [Aspergillus terreus]